MGEWHEFARLRHFSLQLPHDPDRHLRADRGVRPHGGGAGRPGAGLRVLHLPHEHAVQRAADSAGEAPCRTACRCSSCTARCSSARSARSRRCPRSCRRAHARRGARDAPPGLDGHLGARRAAAAAPHAEGAQGVALVLANVNEQPLSLIRRSGFEHVLGADQIVPTVSAAFVDDRADLDRPRCAHGSAARPHEAATGGGGSSGRRQALTPSTVKRSVCCTTGRRPWSAIASARISKKRSAAQRRHRPGGDDRGWPPRQAVAALREGLASARFTAARQGSGARPRCERLERTALAVSCQLRTAALRSTNDGHRARSRRLARAGQLRLRFGTTSGRSTSVRDARHRRVPAGASRSPSRRSTPRSSTALVAPACARRSRPASQGAPIDLHQPPP